MQLMLFQVKALVPVPDMDGVYTHRGHPVRMVEVMGVVRRVHRAPKMFVYTLDDGTDTLNCIIWIPDRLQSLRDTSAEPWLEPYELGQVLNIVGRPGEFRGQSQLTFQHNNSTVCTDPNAETLFRLRVLTKERYVYPQTVNVSGIDVEEATRIHKDQPPTTLMIDKLRLWLQHRTLFFFTDIEEDEGNRNMAASIVNNLEPDLTQLQVKMKAHRLIVMVVHRLLSTGEIDYYDRPKMRFRVAELKIVR
ncbi:CST complex subunit STN1 [Mortierella alpina]|nr:CST complex subunit STN1 [Mortierella alpina]